MTCNWSIANTVHSVGTLSTKYLLSLYPFAVMSDYSPGQRFIDNVLLVNYQRTDLFLTSYFPLRYRSPQRDFGVAFRNENTVFSFMLQIDMLCVIKSLLCASTLHLNSDLSISIDILQTKISQNKKKQCIQKDNR